MCVCKHIYIHTIHIYVFKNNNQRIRTCHLEKGILMEGFEGRVVKSGCTGKSEIVNERKWCNSISIEKYFYKNNIATREQMWMQDDGYVNYIGHKTHTIHSRKYILYIMLLSKSCIWSHGSPFLPFFGLRFAIEMQFSEVLSIL